MLRLFSTRTGLVIERDGTGFSLAQPLTLDAIFQSADPLALLHSALGAARPVATSASEWSLLAPLQSQEVWAAGVTYFRSRTARMEESKVAGGGSF